MKTPEEIKKGLECCTPVWTGDHWKSCNSNCLYIGLADSCRGQLMYDALAYIQQLESKLAEYEKPLVPLPEEHIYNDPVWLEVKAENDIPRIVDVIPSFANPAERAEIAFIGQDRRAHLPYSHYGSSWRCWSRKPTDAERKAAKWDEDVCCGERG